MDDLLITRMSDRSRERFARRPMNAPAGAGFGMVLGLGLGLSLAAAWQANPLVGLAFGFGIGAALGGLFGKFMQPAKRRKRLARIPYSYDGFPISEAAEPEEGQPSAKPDSKETSAD